MNCPECGCEVRKSKVLLYPVFFCGSSIFDGRVNQSEACKIIKRMRTANSVLNAEINELRSNGNGTRITQAQSKQWSEEFCKAHGIEVKK